MTRVMSIILVRSFINKSFYR